MSNQQEVGRVDLTDEQIIERMESAGFTSSDNVTNGTFIYGNIEACRALLANTAQGKPCKKFQFNPEHWDHCDFCKCSRSDHALAAKKG